MECLSFGAAAPARAAISDVSKDSMLARSAVTERAVVFVARGWPATVIVLLTLYEPMLPARRMRRMTCEVVPPATVRLHVVPLVAPFEATGFAAMSVRPCGSVTVRLTDCDPPAGALTAKSTGATLRGAPLARRLT